MTLFGFESQAHSIALHILSAITSYGIGSFFFLQIVLAILTVLLQYSANVSPCSFFGDKQTPHGLCFPSRNSVQSGLTPGLVLLAPKVQYTVDVFHPLSGTSPSTARLCFCKSSHSSTLPSLHFCIRSSTQSSVFPDWKKNPECCHLSRKVSRASLFACGSQCPPVISEA